MSTESSASGTSSVEVTRANPFEKRPKETFPEPAVGTPERELTALPDERVAATMMTMQASQLRMLLEQLSPRKRQFLKMRAVSDTDAKAMHLMGHMRREDDPNYDRDCACGVHLKHWIDMREATLWSWKRQEVFKRAYDALIIEPMMFSRAWMESLGVKTLAAYDDLLDPETPAHVRRSAAKDMLEALDLKPTVGVQGSGKDKRETDSWQFNMALSRWQRGLPISDSQRQMLSAAGYEVGEQTKQIGMTSRSLDGRDVPLEGDVVDPAAERGSSNDAFLPD